MQENNSIVANLSIKEQNELNTLLNGRSFNEQEAIEILIDSVLRHYEEAHKQSLSEYVGNDKSLAKLLLTSFERYEGADIGELYELYVFDNKDPREDNLQRELLKDMVKQIRSLTGLSQAKFAERYDINKRSLQAWEIGAKKISKYAYNYLKSAITDHTTIISTTRTVNLPIKILDEESIEYLRFCSDEDAGAPDAIVSHVMKGPWMGEAYILYLERYETVINGEVRKQWECFPEALKKCIRPVSPYNINKIVFDYDEEIYSYYKELINHSEHDIEAKLEEVMRSRSNRANIKSK